MCHSVETSTIWMSLSHPSSSPDLGRVWLGVLDSQDTSTQLCVAFYLPQYYFCIPLSACCYFGFIPTIWDFPHELRLTPGPSLCFLVFGRRPSARSTGWPQGTWQRTRPVARSAPWRWWPSWAMTYTRIRTGFFWHLLMTCGIALDVVLTFDQTCIHDSLYMLLRWCIHVPFWTICFWCILWTMYVYSGRWCISCWYDAMYDIISAFQCYTISVDVYFPFHCTLWMACFTFLLILCYCCCAHDNDVSHTLHREWGVTAGIRAPGSNTCGLGYLSGSLRA